MSVLHSILRAAILALLITRSTAAICSNCPGSDGHISKCTVDGGDLLASANAVSLLQCFDHCIRQEGCEFYAYDSKLSVCKMYSKSLESVLKSKLVEKEGSFTAWINRGPFKRWLVPICGTDGLCNEISSFDTGWCGKPLDIVFLIDTYVTLSSVLTSQKAFIENVLKKFDLGQEATMPSVITYDEGAKLELSFNNFSTSSEFFTKVRAISLSLESGSRYDKALNLSVTQAFSSQHGARPLAHRVVVLIANNNLDSGSGKVADINNAVAGKCARVFVLTVGTVYKDPETFATGPPYARTFNGFADLNATVEDEMARAFCSDLV
ncbi:uncharacterized protein LOC125573206 [Nematostella vectensis]|uniref:uncharacterized protein LOC125573206 n=1 Tax=Nematostella vectensis TaxID=45351 RepID=UPI002077148F|nr:uncharacterized protein LOC125573206 [Nematostella vectensis]